MVDCYPLVYRTDVNAAADPVTQLVFWYSNLRIDPDTLMFGYPNAADSSLGTTTEEPDVTDPTWGLDKNANLFAWCPCSDGTIPSPDKRSKSKFLSMLRDDLIPITESYYRLPKPVDEYIPQEDEYVAMAKSFLQTSIHDRDTIHSYIEDIGIEPGFDYILLNYLSNTGYMEHGISLRCGYLA